MHNYKEYDLCYKKKIMISLLAARLRQKSLQVFLKVSCILTFFDICNH